MYEYVVNDPINLIDIYGLQVGRRFSNRDYCARNALDNISDIAKKNLNEYAGWIIRNPDGTFSYTKPIQGGEFGFNNEQMQQFLDSRPKEGANSWYHIHEENDTIGHVPGWPSSADGNFSQTQTSSGLGYLKTPTGEYIRFNQNVGHLLIFHKGP